MCYFVFLGLEKSRAAATEPFRRAPEFHLRPARTLNDEEVSAAFLSSDVLFVVSGGGHGCSCGFYDTRPHVPGYIEERQQAEAMRKEEAWRRAGWSEAKITRALADHRKAAAPRSTGKSGPLAVAEVVCALVAKVDTVRLYAKGYGRGYEEDDALRRSPYSITARELLAAEGIYAPRTLVEVRADR